jgi:hypothetical protein
MAPATYLGAQAPAAPIAASADDVAASVGTQFVDPLRARIEALERTVAMMEDMLRAQREEVEPRPSVAEQALGLLPVLLGVLTLLAMAAAIGAIARAHRTRLEVTRLQTVSKLLTERVGVARDDELRANLQRILQSGAG